MGANKPDGVLGRVIVGVLGRGLVIPPLREGVLGREGVVGGALVGGFFVNAGLDDGPVCWGFSGWELL